MFEEASSEDESLASTEDEYWPAKEPELPHDGRDSSCNTTSEPEAVYFDAGDSPTARTLNLHVRPDMADSCTAG